MITIWIVALTVGVSLLAFNQSHWFEKLAHYPVAEYKRGEKYRWLTGGLIHADVFIYSSICMYCLNLVSW